MITPIKTRIFNDVKDKIFKKETELLTCFDIQRSESKATLNKF